ncbi:hypothetical protein PY254_07315 [Rhodanobacter sp. AS-Z3]|uniref:hypothetical protein n=1 Tax=Rhodanobacter sp. AS-Z3 TaxID=3031330 RepID=UPI00247906CA|nr:hypothetical protein [Rhodanobacter sp. AS-Z3]WEN16463.1 hypothetical protein PY254_07315 [Rhodanobacter sp. AS-Z3]
MQRHDAQNTMGGKPWNTAEKQRHLFMAVGSSPGRDRSGPAACRRPGFALPDADCLRLSLAQAAVRLASRSQRGIRFSEGIDKANKKRPRLLAAFSVAE